jgi:uncharacterized protein
MDFEWDPAKAAANWVKHALHLADATPVFEDPYAITRADPHPSEDRFVTLGRNALDRVIVVVWAWHGDAIRLISARGATARERRTYAEDADA